MILISEQELKLLKTISDQELTQEDWEVLLENKKVLTKYFRKMITNVQISLWLWQYRGKENIADAKIATLNELIIWLEGIEWAFTSYKNGIEIDL